MTLLDTIPIYRSPIWLVIIMAIAGIGLLFAFITHEDDFAPILTIVCVIILVAGIIINIGGWFKVLDHDEYVIELTDMSATEFFKDYKPIKTFEYSNAIQVRKKDGVK